MFQTITTRSQQAGILRQVFRFVDATAIETKKTTWEERDKALEKVKKKLNNQNIKNTALTNKLATGAKEKVNFGMAIKDMPVWIWDQDLLIGLLALQPM